MKKIIFILVTKNGNGFGNVYKCLAGEKVFKPMWGIKDGDGVISLTYEENKNVLYATTWNGRGKMDARDGALYE